MSYYEDQLKKIDFSAKPFPPKVKFSDENRNETNWLSINKESAIVIVEHLKKYLEEEK
ncbi:MAG: hypothetical protein WC549_01920 [Actinomycetota bacterium]